MTILSALTDEFLEEHFAPETLERGETYRDRLDGPPEISQLTPGAVTATAYVVGTRPTPYHVQLHAEVGKPTGLSRTAPKGWLFTLCTCPVRTMCKHGAAVALSIRAGHVDTAAGHDWERRLGALVDDLARDAGPAETDTLALQVALDDAPGRYRGAPAVRVRPLRRGARGSWIKTGAEWSDVNAAIIARRYEPAQADAIGALHSALQAHRGYFATGLAPTLDQFGGRAVDLLHAAEAAGIPLVPQEPLREVVLHRDPVGLGADLTATEGGTRLTLGVEVDGGLRRGGDVLLMGQPPLLVAIADRVDQRLTLAPLAGSVPRAARDLLEGAPIDVPAEDLGAFLDRLSPVLRRLAVRSSDGSVDVPAPIAPILLLTVTWLDPSLADLRWEWRYGRTRHCELGSLDRLGGLRDRAAERRIRDQVPAGLLGRHEVAGGDALAFALHDVPFLESLDGVEVVQEERPDFREAEEEVEIVFDLVEPDEEVEDGHTDWLDLEVTVTVEGERIPLPDVLAALTLGQEFLVLPSGLYVATDRPELDRLREVVAAASELREADGDRIGVGRHDLGVWAQLAETGIVDAQAAEWVRRAEALRSLDALPRPEPVGLATELRSYQREGFWWLAFLYDHGLGGILADDMGLGKTLQVLALIQYAAARGEGPFLVVAPTSVVSAWAQEAERHTPGLRVGVVQRGSDDVARIAAESDVVVTTYALLRLGRDSYAGVAWAGLVLDEAQQVKNHQSKTYAAVRAVAAPFRLVVTGTPFENRLMELWALLSIAVPGLYPWPRQFNERVVRPIEKGADQQALERFRRRIRPFLLRRTKELVAEDLPPKQEQVLDVVLGPRHRKLYDTHLAKERQRILGLVEDFDRNRVAIFSALTTLRQLALDPALVDEAHEGVGSAKLDLLVEHLTEMADEGHRALVFSQFTSFLGRVRTRLEAEGIATTYLDGATRDRPTVIQRFRDGAAPVFLISLKAGGVGLTLTEADYVFVLDPWWNPAAEAQAVDRAHRIGQSAHVHVYRMVAADTIEEKVMELKARKAELFGRVIDGDGALSTGIDADDIRGLFGD
ncbi:MAG TPA: DEAD/DEAH box helicase [Nocardioides sp.]|nr:DEAD/DEAH box helicase [Nocardioides sp.]